MKPSEQFLKNRVAIVTGAGKGLGRAWAKCLARLGARVVVNNRASSPYPATRSADAVVSEIRARGGEAVADYRSVESPGAGQELVNLALEEYGALDIIIANAGTDSARSFHQQSLADFERIIEINFLAVARLLHAAWPVMRTGNYGRILVATSTAGLYGNHGQAAYASSKAALQGLVKTLTIEGRSRDIRVNSIAPYAVTQMTRAAFPDRHIENFFPEATEDLAAWLVSDRCKISGKTLVVGAGHARLAQSLESDTIPLGEDIQAAIERLFKAGCDNAPASAIEEFEDFSTSVQ